MSKDEISIVWLKRDLRIHDHGPLSLCSELSSNNPNFRALIIYIDEKGYWDTDKASPAQHTFICQCLQNMRTKIEELNNTLYWIKGFNDAKSVFEKLSNFYQIKNVYSHKETGNNWTFQRDIRVKRFLKDIGATFIELDQDCIVRGSKSKTASLERPFSSKYTQFNYATQHKEPTFIRGPKSVPPWMKKVDSTSSPMDSQVNSSSESYTQRGGEDTAIDLLLEFLAERCLMGKGYRFEMSNPYIGSKACSRLSAHLTWGSISQRATFQTAQEALKTLDDYDYRKKHIQSFITRLAWRPHFMQKFESLYWMEFKCLNPKAETLHGWNQEWFERWSLGMTGYPFVDACMRSLNQTKWLNFRARALLVSFGAYALNLDWRGFGPHLARNFLDYEPGIHYSQLQMQSGTTLGSPPRIYSPLKQSVEKDPKGEFIRQWIPELRDVSSSLIHIPQDYSRKGYPSAIIPTSNLWAIMRSNAPSKRERTPTGLRNATQTRIKNIPTRNRMNLVQTELFAQ